MKTILSFILIALSMNAQGSSLGTPSESSKLADPRKSYIQAQREMYCFNLNAIWKAAEELGQNIVWVGKDSDNQTYTLLVSEKDKHFTIVTFRETLGCILGGGTDFRYGNAFEQPKKDSKK